MHSAPGTRTAPCRWRLSSGAREAAAAGLAELKKRVARASSCSKRAAETSIQSRTGPLSRGNEQNDFRRSIEAPQAVRASTPPSQRFGPLGRSAERKERTHHFMRPGTVASLWQTHMSSPGARGRQQSRRTEGNPGWVKAPRQQQRAALEDLFLFIELLQLREKSTLGNLIGRSRSGACAISPGKTAPRRE